MMVPVDGAYRQSIAGRPGPDPWVRVLPLTRPGGTCHRPDPNFGFFTIFFSSDTPNFKFCNIEKILEVLVQMIIFSKRKRNVFEGVKVSKSDFHFFQLWKKIHIDIH